MALLVFDPHTEPCLFESVIEELGRPEREKEIDQYPKSYVALVHYLCLKGHYSEKLISNVLDPDFITKTYGEFITYRAQAKGR